MRPLGDAVRCEVGSAEPIERVDAPWPMGASDGLPSPPAAITAIMSGEGSPVCCARMPPAKPAPGGGEAPPGEGALGVPTTLVPPGDGDPEPLEVAVLFGTNNSRGPPPQGENRPREMSFDSDAEADDPEEAPPPERADAVATKAYDSL